MGVGIGSHVRAARLLVIYATSSHAPIHKQIQAWDYSKWTPDAVVILIGPNDELSIEGKESVLGRGVNASSSSFIASYIQLLEMVATNYKAAPTSPKIVHVCGGSLNGLDPCSDIQKANDMFNKGKNNHGLVGYFTSITTDHWYLINGGNGNGKSGKTAYNGCDGHYNVKGHGIVAGDILPQLKKIMGW